MQRHIFTAKKNAPQVTLGARLFFWLEALSRRNLGRRITAG